jgi:hypothetical protein
MPEFYTRRTSGLPPSIFEYARPIMQYGRQIKADRRAMEDYALRKQWEIEDRALRQKQLEDAKQKEMANTLIQLAKTPGVSQEYLGLINPQILKATGGIGLPQEQIEIEGGTEPQTRFITQPTEIDKLKSELDVKLPYEIQLAQAKDSSTDIGEFVRDDELARQGDLAAKARNEARLKIKRAQPGEVYDTAVAKGQAQAYTAEDISRAKKEGELGTEKKYSFPKVKNKMSAQLRDWDQLDKRIDSAIKNVSNWTSGVGAWTKVIPATDAKRLSEDLKTIAANVSFSKLQEMRESSPTGGALGQVSDFENKLLQATRGSMEQSLSPTDLTNNLMQIKDYLKGLKSDTQNAFQADYGDFIKSGNNIKVTGSNFQQGGSKKGELTDANIAKEYLNKAGGDKNKARELAKQDGWEF